MDGITLPVSQSACTIPIGWCWQPEPGGQGRRGELYLPNPSRSVLAFGRFAIAESHDGVSFCNPISLQSKPGYSDRRERTTRLADITSLLTAYIVLSCHEFEWIGPSAIYTYELCSNF